MTPYKVLATSTKHGESVLCLYSLVQEQCISPVWLNRFISGFMQFVQSVPVAEVLATEGNIQVQHNNFSFRQMSDNLWDVNLLFLQQSFFRKHAPSEKGPYGISSEVMDTYVKSCGESLFLHSVKVSRNMICGGKK